MKNNYKLDGPITVRNEYGDIIASGIFESLDGSERFMFTCYANEEGYWGHEYYKGVNYLLGDNSRSYSRNFKYAKGMPGKYTKIALDLKYKVGFEMIEGGFIGGKKIWI